jgi:hypothetical protein
VAAAPFSKPLTLHIFLFPLDILIHRLPLYPSHGHSLQYLHIPPRRPYLTLPFCQLHFLVNFCIDGSSAMLDRGSVLDCHSERRVAMMVLLDIPHS